MNLKKTQIEFVDINKVTSFKVVSNIVPSKRATVYSIELYINEFCAMTITPKDEDDVVNVCEYLQEILKQASISDIIQEARSHKLKKVNIND